MTLPNPILRYPPASTYQGLIFPKRVFCSPEYQYVGQLNQEVNKLTGIIQTTVSCENGKAIIEFDQAQTGIEKIEKAIEKTGYSVTDRKEIK